MQEQIVFPTQKVVQLTKSDELIGKVEELHWRPIDDDWQFIWRGHGDSRFSLVPSALRSAGRAFLKECHAKTTPVVDTQDTLELLAVSSFYRHANWHGYSLPTVDPEWHRILIGAPMSLMTDRAYIERLHGLTWPPRALESIVALAQHYGVPTRLLDWTTDALTAIYFAARDAMLRLSTFKKSGQDVSAEKLAVWRAWEQSFRMTELVSAGDGAPVLGVSRVDPKCRIRVIAPPYGTNANLSAQKGRFTCVSVDRDHPDINDDFPMDKVHNYILALRRVEGTQESHPSLACFELPIVEAPKLFRWLIKRECDAARIFPGLRGIAIAAEERALCSRLLTS